MLSRAQRGETSEPNYNDFWHASVRHEAKTYRSEKDRALGELKLAIGLQELPRLERIIEKGGIRHELEDSEILVLDKINSALGNSAIKNLISRIMPNTDAEWSSARPSVVTLSRTSA